MDYEFRIMLLEKELAHYREMQAIVRERQDTSDARHERSESLMEAVGAALLSVITNLDKLSDKVDALVSALLREHTNGR